MKSYSKPSKIRCPVCGYRHYATVCHICKTPNHEDKAMRMYDPEDFAANPRKYELFKTATVARHIITHNGDADIEAGAHVGIEYFCTAPNKLFRRNEPVYRIAGTDRHLYANCLADFVL